MSTTVGHLPTASPPSATPEGPRLRRVGLGLFFLSLAVNAVLGIAAVLSPDFGHTARNVLLTSLTVTGFLLVCLAVAPAWERRRLWPVPPLAVVLATFTALLTLVMIWAEPGGDVWGQVYFTALVLVIAAVVASLLGLARLQGRFSPVLWADLLLLAVATAMIVLSIWLEPSTSMWARANGVVFILLGAAVVATPVLHWISRPVLAAEQALVRGETRYCPFCGATVVAALDGPAACGRCGSAFVVHREDEGEA